MFKKFIAPLVVLCLAFSGTLAAAQAGENGASPKLKEKLVSAESKLKKIEFIIRKIEQGKVIKEKDSADLDSTLYSYAETMKFSISEALADTEKAAKSKGKEGNINALKYFEKQAKAHEARLKVVDNKTKNIKANLKKGEVSFDEPMLKKMTPDVKSEFKQFLDPEGRRKIEKKYPKMFKSSEMFKGSEAPGKSVVDLNKLRVAGDNAVAYCPSALEKISNFFISPAEANPNLQVSLLGVGCIGVCTTTVAAGPPAWALCATCLGKVGVAAVSMWDTFVTCWSGVNKSRWSPLWLHRIGCVTWFGGILA